LGCAPRHHQAHGGIKLGRSEEISQAAEFCFVGDTIRLPTTIRLPAGGLLLFPPASVARDIFDGVENGEQEIFPDPLSETLVEGGHKAVARRSRQNAPLVVCSV